MENELRDLIIEYGENILPRLAEYEIHSSTFNAVVATVLALVVIAVAIFIYRMRKNKRSVGEYCGDPDLDFIWYALLGAIVFILIIFVGCEVSDIYYAKYLPEKLLLRHLKYMLGNM